MVLRESVPVPLGSDAIDFELPGTDGEEYTLDSFSDSKILVIVFTCNHCPYAQALEDRLLHFYEEFKDKGVQIIAINSNDGESYPDDDFEAMQDKEYPFPYLHDEDQEVAHAYKAQCTPDIYVYDEFLKLAYHGRFDDNWKNPADVESEDLKEAVEALINGKKVNPDQKPSMGCSIKWK